MATRNANAIIEEFDDAPTIEEFDDAAAPAAAIEEIDDEVVAEEAQRATEGAKQALYVMERIGRADWSEANEKMDAERFREAEAMKPGTKTLTFDGTTSEVPETETEFQTRKNALLSQVSPHTSVGKFLAERTAAEQDLTARAQASNARRDEFGTYIDTEKRTPSESLSRLLGPGLSPTITPIAEGAARQALPAVGGILGAARFIPHPGAQMASQIGLPMLGAIAGSMTGGHAQEALLQIGETPEETQRRQQLATEDQARNPGLTLLGGALASSPFVGPSMAQFGRAAAGDVGAMANLGIGGALNAGGAMVSAMTQGRFADAKEISEAFFLGMAMNEPTKLGRKLGLKPSSEQQAVEDATAAEIAATREVPSIPIGPTSEVGVVAGMRQAPSAIPRKPPTTDSNAQQISKAGTPDGSVRSPEVPLQNEPLPTPEGGEGVQPSGQRGPLAEATPEAPREIASDEQRIAKLVEAGMSPEDAVAGLARLKALEAPPVVETPITETPVTETPVVETPIVEDPKVTSLKNVVTAAERAAREIPQAAETERRAWTKAWDEAKAETPAATDALLAGLEKKAKPLSDKQHAMLLHRQIELQKAYDVTAEEVNRAAEAGDEPLRLEALERLNNTRDALQKVYDVEKAAGAESGRGLAARKMWANQDFELVPMEMRLRADNGGRLSEEQAAQVKAQADTIAKTQAEMDRILAENNALKAQVEADKAVDPKVKSLADRIIARLDLSAANAAKSLRSRLANLGAAPDPLIVLDVAKIAAAKTAKGAIEFAQWSAEMVKEFGEKIRPFLQAGWDRREQIIDGEISTGTKATKAAKASTSVLQENRRLKALTRLIVRAEAELAGAARRGKQQGPESQPVAEARQKLKAVREQLQAKREADPAVRQAKIEAAEAAVEKAIRTLDAQLQAGDIAVKRAPSKAGSQRLEDLRLQRDAMNRLRNELRAEARPKADPIEAQVKGRLTAIANRTAEYNRRAAEGDFSPMRKPPLDLSKNPEWVKAKAANDAAKAAYEKSRYEARKAQRTTEQKVRDTIADVWSASRPILASTDISAPGRQGIFFSLPDLFTNPVRLGRQLRSMFRSQFSESKFQENEAAIKSRDNADLYEESDLYLADIDHKPSAREEQFKSELAEKIPGIGRIVRGSSRGFSSFMNTVRADAMDAFVKWSGGRENINPETAKFLAAAINDLSGRGNVTSRQAQGALEWLAKYLFSPRLWVSRYNTARLKPIWKDPLNREISLRARGVVAAQYVKFLGALFALKFLAGLWGGKVEEDPRDSDFGKLQFGSKRYDVTGGIGNMITFLARVFSGKTKDDKGKTLRIVWGKDSERPERELGMIVFQHLRNKMAPIPGAVYDLRYGRHPDRSKVTPTSMLKQTTVPITVSDTVEFFRKDNPAAAMRDTLINALGVSVNDYRK